MKNKNLLKIATFFLVFKGMLTYGQETVKFMTFNIWQEGTSVTNGLTKIRDVIIATNADVVCFTEVRNYSGDWTTKIVNELSDAGHMYYRGYAGGDVSLISKYPITSSSLNGVIASFNLNVNDKKIVAASAHLDYTKYACYLPRGYNGGTPDWNRIDDGMGNPDPITDINQILSYNLSSSRDEQIATFISAMSSEEAPIILLGDFNEPSHLDWTANTTAMFDHNGTVVPWQTSVTLSNNGYVDSYRDYYPNEVTHPGISWPSLAHGKESTSWTPLSDERDRIDYIYYKGSDIVTTNVAIVGPKESYSKNQIVTTNTSNENFIADNLDWPSDHKGVFSELKFSNLVVAAEEITNPILSLIKETFDVGETIRLSYANGPGNAKDWIGVYKVGVTPGSGSPSLLWDYVGASGVIDVEAIGNGTAWPLIAGSYFIAFFENDGYSEIATRVAFKTEVAKNLAIEVIGKGTSKMDIEIVNKNNELRIILGVRYKNISIELVNSLGGIIQSNNFIDKKDVAITLEAIPSGVYFVRITADAFKESRSVVIV